LVVDEGTSPRLALGRTGLASFGLVLGLFVLGLIFLANLVWGYEWNRQWLLYVFVAAAVGISAVVIAGSSRARQLLTRRPGGVEAWRYLAVLLTVSLLLLKISPTVERQGVGGGLFSALAVGPFVLYLSGFWRWWNVFNPPKQQRRLAVAVAIFGGLTVLTVVVAVATAAVGVQGLLKEAGPNAREASDLGDDLTVGSLSAYYVWHVLEAIPGVDIPKTVNWDAPYKFKDSWSGGLLLFYKLLVILPIAAIIKELFSAKEDAEKARYIPRRGRPTILFVPASVEDATRADGDEEPIVLTQEELGNELRQRFGWREEEIASEPTLRHDRFFFWPSLGAYSAQSD
jgi:hypothetical protein